MRSIWITKGILRSIVKNALKFLNCDCDMVHGNVNVSSIFTNDAGEWKLGGFEVLSSMKEESPVILVRVIIHFRITIMG